MSAPSIDLRTRRGDEPDVSPTAVDAELLPAARAAHGDLAERGMAVLGLPGLSFEVDDQRIDVAASVDGRPAAVARLSAEALSDLVLDRRSAMGLVLGNDVEMAAGDVSDFLEWEPVLRALIDGRPVYESRSVGFDGIELGRSFRLGDDDPELIARHLVTAGFVHLQGVFSAGEMDAVSADIDAAVGRYRPDDGRSWWARTSAGEHRPVRLQEFDVESPALGALMADERYRSIAALVSDDLVQNEITEALIKPIGVVEGISDVPWHKDCSLGGHSSTCCGLTVGISVTGADARSGMLCAVAGSNRANVAAVGLSDSLDLPVVELPTSQGDVTVHLSCTLHMSVPPTAGERRVVYTGFRQRPVDGNDAWGVRSAVRKIREAAPTRISQTSDELGRVGRRAYKTP